MPLELIEGLKTSKTGRKRPNHTDGHFLVGYGGFQILFSKTNFEKLYFAYFSSV